MGERSSVIGLISSTGLSHLETFTVIVIRYVTVKDMYVRTCMVKH